MPRTLVVNSKGELTTRRDVTKGEDDTLQINVDFGLFFGTDAANTATVTTDDTGITLGTPTVSSNVVTFTVSSGSDGYVYDVQVKLAGTTETKEVIVQVRVFDAESYRPNDYGFYG